MLKTDIATRIESNSFNSGDNMLAYDKSMPAKSSTINGTSFNWSRVVFVGGNHVVSGSKLFTQYQPIWDPRITWVGNVVRKRVPVYWSGTGIASNTYASYFTDTAALNQTLTTSGVVRGDSLAGASSLTGTTGTIFPAATPSARLTAGSGWY